MLCGCRKQDRGHPQARNGSIKINEEQGRNIQIGCLEKDERELMRDYVKKKIRQLNKRKEKMDLVFWCLCVFCSLFFVFSCEKILSEQR